EYLEENFLEIESETGQDILTTEEVGIFQTLDRAAGPVNVNAFVDRVQQPAKPRAILNVLGHFLLHVRKAIRHRPQLHDEVRTDPSHFLAIFRLQILPPSVTNPPTIGTPLRAVGLREAGRSAIRGSGPGTF